MIKSIGYNQEEIIRDILVLHNGGAGIEVDITYSIGNFYKKGIVEQPVYKFDKYPKAEDIRQLESVLPFENNSIQSIMCDLPFVISKGPSLSENIEGQNITHNRFGSFENPTELFTCYEHWINESFRVLKPNGILIFKCQDQISSGKNYTISYFSMDRAIKAGFNIRDCFILLAKQRITSGKWINQFHSRKWHSYFYCFKKERGIDYNKRII